MFNLFGIVGDWLSANKFADGGGVGEIYEEENFNEFFKKYPADDTKSWGGFFDAFVDGQWHKVDAGLIEIIDDGSGKEAFFPNPAYYDWAHKYELAEKDNDLATNRNGSFIVKNADEAAKAYEHRILKMRVIDSGEAFAKGGIVVYLDGNKADTFKTKKALYDFVRSQTSSGVKKVEIDYGNRIIPTFDTYVIEDGKLIHKGELFQPKIDKDEVERKRAAAEKNINDLLKG